MHQILRTRLLSGWVSLASPAPAGEVDSAQPKTEGVFVYPLNPEDPLRHAAHDTSPAGAGEASGIR